MIKIVTLIFLQLGEMTWATPCNGNVECDDGSDEKGCESSLLVIAVVLLSAGIIICFTLFIYLHKYVNNAIITIINSDSIPTKQREDSTKLEKLIYIAILTMNEEVDEVKKIFKKEIEASGSEGKGLCYFKVF